MNNRLTVKRVAFIVGRDVGYVKKYMLDEVFVKSGKKYLANAKALEEFLIHRSILDIK